MRTRVSIFIYNLTLEQATRCLLWCLGAAHAACLGVELYKPSVRGVALSIACISSSWAWVLWRVRRQKPIPESASPATPMLKGYSVFAFSITRDTQQAAYGVLKARSGAGARETVLSACRERGWFTKPGLWQVAVKEYHTGTPEAEKLCAAVEEGVIGIIEVALDDEDSCPDA